MTDKKNLSHNPPLDVGMEFQRFQKENDELKEKEFRDKIKKLEPYNLSEIEDIFKKAIKSSSLPAMYIAQKKINRIIQNSEEVYHIYEKYGRMPNPYDPDDHFDELAAANNLKTQLEIRITELQFEATKQAKSNVERKDEKLHTNTLVEVNCSIPERTEKTYMSSKQIADRIGVSKSKIDHMISKEAIPYRKIGSRVIFITDEIDKWLKAKNQKSADIDPGLENQTKEKPEYVFKVSPDLFTNVFVKHGYLTEPNAEKMVDRFKDPPKEKDDSKIVWGKGKLKSLLTFILVLDIFEQIETDESNRMAKNIALDGQNDGVKLEPLIQNNFFIEKGGSTSRISQRNEEIVNALTDIQRKVKLAFGKEISTFKETLKYFYANESKIKLAEKYKKGIDWEMLKIVFDAS